MSGMTYFLLEYRYADPDARARVRPEHLAYMGSLHDAGAVVLAGPTADSRGAVVVLDVADESAAREVLAADPYTREGVSTVATLREWNVVIPAQK
jgi:uncharacterized protein YciI